MEVMVAQPCSNLGADTSVVLDGVTSPLKDQVHRLGVLVDLMLLLGKAKAAAGQPVKYGSKQSLTDLKRYPILIVAL